MRPWVDLVLSSGEHLLVLEFMRPGLALNWDHTSRCERYILGIREAIKNQTGARFTTVSGYIVADNIDSDSTIRGKITELRKSGIVVTNWNGLLDNAKASWRDYLDILVGRGHGDPRLESLRD